MRNMRLTNTQSEIITRILRKNLGDDAQVWLFGSRTDEAKRGGDIDVYVEAAPHALQSELRCKIEIEDSLDMPVDLIVRAYGDSSPIANIAKASGVRL